MPFKNSTSFGYICLLQLDIFFPEKELIRKEIKLGFVGSQELQLQFGSVLPRTGRLHTRTHMQLAKLRGGGKMPMAIKVFILCLLSITMLGSITPLHASVRRYRFELVNSLHTKLCTNKTMITVNGQFPGPTIYARRGDLVIVDVINNADQNITIHWHGVKMPRYPWSDGTNYVTQCPIIPGTRFRQRIILSDEEGTLWWHAHSDWTRATVNGAIVILPPKSHTFPFPKPHAQFPLLLGEYWKGDMQKLLDEFFATGSDSRFCDALLINGEPGDKYPCSKQDAYKLRVEFGKTYLVRLVNTMLNYIVQFRIAGHNMTVVGTDGAYTKPVSTDYVSISPGQTIDFLLEANQPPARYYMVGQVYAGSNKYAPTTATIEYAGLAASSSPPSSPSFPQIGKWTDFTNFTVRFTKRLRSLANNNHPILVPKNIDITHRLFYVLAMNLWPCNLSTCLGTERSLASINNISMVLPRTADILDAYYRGISGVYTTDFPDFPPTAYDYIFGKVERNESLVLFETAVRVLDYNSVVEIVFQGTNHADGFDHPMHLHGHSFYFVGSGFGNFDESKDPDNYNLVDPPLMETIDVPRVGWAAIRFRANNPGVWFMHCHFDRHQSWGLKMAFIVKDGEAPNEKMLPPPPDLPRCGREPLSSSNNGRITNSVESKPFAEN